MKKWETFRRLRCFEAGVICFAGLFLFSDPALPKDIYKFERMWPTLQQPWYFSVPLGMAVDRDGNVFVAEQGNHRISKLTPDGRFISSWGRMGRGEGELDTIWGIALDDAGNVYVADSDASCIHKFTSNGRFIRRWGKLGKDDGQFDSPAGVAVDDAGNVYVVDVDNHRIQKFTLDGRFLGKWGKRGKKAGEFNLRSSVNEGWNAWFPGIAVDRGGKVYVADIGNHRIQKFDSEGRLLALWGSKGSGNGKLDKPAGIAIDRQGNVCVIDSGNGRIQKFTSQGQFIGTAGRPWSPDRSEGLFLPWGMAFDSSGNMYVSEPLSPAVRKLRASGRFMDSFRSGGARNGFFDYPAAAAVDGAGNIYVADYFNCRIQKFTATGRLIAKWGKYGTKDGEFALPVGIALDGPGHVYVVDQNNHRIQKFTADGVFLRKWGGEGSGHGKFKYPFHAAVDVNGNVYVTDTGNYRVQKFDADGKYLCSWGSRGKKDGQFGWRYFYGDIAADADGNVYVTDGDNHRIQKFTSDGKSIGSWAQNNTGKAKLSYPNCVAMDERGNVCVVDWSTPFIDAVTRVKLYTREGNFISSWGEQGTNPGQLHFPSSMAVSSKGSIIITDYELSNVQVFKRASMESLNKAIVVAGGGPYEGNNLWEATEMNANFAYRTLTYQGFTKERICYLSSDTGLDLDSNGAADDVDGDATCANLRKAVTEWAGGAHDVLIYLADHGGGGGFRMSGKETLSAGDLGSWLDSLEGNITGKLIILYDACHSGSFLSALVSSSGKKRIVIASTSAVESAYFVNYGSISFSSYFWTHVFNGLDVFDAFTLAREAMSYTTDFQHPLLDDNGNGLGNEPQDGALAQTTFIGNGTSTSNEAPAIGAVSPHQVIHGTDSAQLYAQGVSDKDGVARVWAVVRPPDFNPGPDGNPIRELPSVDFLSKGMGRYETSCKGFNVSGTYPIAVYASDGIGNISIPKLTTVSVDSPLRRRAILVAGGSASDPLWPAIEKNVASAHEALAFQGYKGEDIVFMSPLSIPGVDMAPTIANLRHAVEKWAGKDTKDVVLYLVGNGSEGAFTLSHKETLSAPELDKWLDNLQTQTGARVIVIYDACRSGSFMPLLGPPLGKERIVVTSTGEDRPAAFLSGGDISYSRFFWNQVANGASLREAFLQAKTSIRYACPRQIAGLDDNGNGIGNERTDGEVARGCVIGAGIILAGDAPVIGSVCPEQTLHGKPSALIWVKNVSATRRIEKVWAVISPPGAHPASPDEPVTDLTELRLHKAGEGRYEGRLHDLSRAGTYGITIYAMDRDSNISSPKITKIVQLVGKN